MDIRSTPLAGLFVLTPELRRDARGFFVESYNRQTLERHSITTTFVQDNHSHSVQNTVRGMHYQLNPGQVKLVRVVQGAIWDVVVDLRHDSPTFGQWYGETLTAENFVQLYVPVGFAHGFCVLSDSADLLYKCSSHYDPATERGLAWNDPTVAIPWPVTDPVLSERDQRQPSLGEAETF